MPWSAKQYGKFEDERTRPVRDLVAAIPTADVHRAADLGCGPGNSTQVLLDRYPHANVVGIDTSEDMISSARQRLPGLSFEVADIATWEPTEPCDVILANAVFHWVPSHEVHLPRLVAALSAAGSLAIQMPDNLAEPSHVLMQRIAEQGPWCAKLSAARGERSEVKSADWYYRLLRSHCSSVDVWRTTYHHPLPNTEGILEWFKGSGLRPYLSALDQEEQEDYLARYREAISSAYAVQSDGSVLLPFPRLFLVATR